MVANNFIHLKMFKVNQSLTGEFFVGRIKFRDLLDVHKLTERHESTFDPATGELNRNDENEQDFQRHLQKDRISQIRRYLEKALFKEGLDEGEDSRFLILPSSLILYNKDYRYYDFEESIDSFGTALEITQRVSQFSNFKELDCCFYTENPNEDGLYDIIIPRNKRITLIVDGQHRFFGAKALYDQLNSGLRLTPERLQEIENYEFVVTLLVGFDLHEVGQIFANVNFNQKPVNKSLYYDIFGASPKTDSSGGLHNQIKLIHDLALHLNNSEKSPIQGMIKLLGRGKGLFSQAFFVDKMIHHVLRKDVWLEYFNAYLMDKKEYWTIGVFMRAYFEALKLAYPKAWPLADVNGEYNPRHYDYVLLKTTGLGAYIRLIPDVYQHVSVTDQEGMKEQILGIFNRLPAEEAYELFKKGGEFSGGSESIQGKLFKRLRVIYGFVGDSDLTTIMEN